MVTSSNSYGTSTGIERLVGDIFVSRTLSSTTVPTILQIDLIIDDIAAEMNVALAANGYTAPVSTADDPIPSRWLESINNWGAAAMVLGTLPMTAIAPGQEDAGVNRMEMYQAFFNRGMTRIADKKVAAARSRGRLAATFAGSQESSDGERKLPVFKRGMDRTPGTRNLTES